MKNLIGRIGKFKNMPETAWHEILGCYGGYKEDYFILRNILNEKDDAVIHLPVNYLLRLKSLPNLDIKI